MRDLVKGNSNWTHINHYANVKLYAHSRKASNFLESHYNLSLGHIGTALGIALPEPMFGVSIHELAAHGHTKEIIEVVTDWKQASKQMNAKVHDFIENSFYKPTDIWAKTYNGHRKAEYLNRLVHKGDAYAIRPTYVMRREHGDISWQLGQEHGCLSPRQFVRGDETLTLINPVEKQKPLFLIYPLWSQDAFAECVTPDCIEKEVLEQVGEYDFFADNNQGEDTHDSDLRLNIDITPRLAQLAGGGDMCLSNTQTGALRIQMDNLTLKPFLDAEYGAAYPVGCNMKNHRGIAVTLIGDGSGAILLLKVAQRDYPIKVDFIGKKTIVIPHGEAAWYHGDWGWRLKTKCSKYAFFEEGYLSIGYIPPQTQVDITVERIVILREEVCRMSALCVLVNNTKIALHSTGGIYSSDVVFYDSETAKLYDKDWHLKEILSIDDANFVVEQGENKVQIQHNGNGNPYFELQLLACDEDKMLSKS